MYTMRTEKLKSMLSKCTSLFGRTADRQMT